MNADRLPEDERDYGAWLLLRCLNGNSTPFAWGIPVVQDQTMMIGQQADDGKSARSGQPWLSLKDA